MGDLRPLGSEKLQGMDKIRRIMEIARYNETPKDDVNNLSTTDYTIQLADGNTYGIVREKSGYIIKKGLNESTLDYTDSIRERKYFNSYSQAMKKLNLMASEINRVVGNDAEIPLIGEQEGGKKKFVLKTPKPKAEPTPEPVMDMPPAPPSPEAPMDTPPSDDMPMDDMGTDDMDMDMGDDTDMGMDDMDMDSDMGDEDESDNEENGFKHIQKLTGKLGQKLRALNKNEEMDSQDIKYVLNSIISALDISNLDEDDKEDILNKLDPEEEEFGMEDEMDFEEEDVDMGSDDFDFESETDIETPETEESYDMMDSMFYESKIDKVISQYFNISEDEKTILEEKEKKNFINQKLKKINVENEIKRLSESFRQYKKAVEILNEGDTKFIGKTNKENLIFKTSKGQIKVTPRGEVI
jgi:hypothetical protein